MVLKYWNVGDRCKIGGQTAIDPLTSLAGKTDVVEAIDETGESEPEMGVPFACVGLEEPVSDGFGQVWERVNVALEFLEDEF